MVIRNLKWPSEFLVKGLVLFLIIKVPNMLTF